MTNQLMLQPIILIKIVLWAAIVTMATMLLRRRRVNSRVRTIFLVSGTMDDFFKDSGFHADCFACGACIEACPREDTLGWWSRFQLARKTVEHNRGS
jgi:ferredoxin